MAATLTVFAIVVTPVYPPVVTVVPVGTGVESVVGATVRLTVAVEPVVLDADITCA